MLRQGSIIRALVRDPKGGNPKTRPLVVLTPTAEIDGKQPIAVVAITSKFSKLLLDDEIALPYHPGGYALTGLRKPCVAKCSWQALIDFSDIVETKGFVSGNLLDRLLIAVTKRG